MNLAARFVHEKLAVDETLAIARDVCAQLAGAHARGRVHGRIVPGDVRRGEAGWEVDFSTAAGGDERDDVRAVAALLAEAIGGEASVAGAMRLPRGHRGPVLRSLDARRDRRHGTIVELARAIGAPVVEPPPRARAPGVAAALVLAALAGAVGRTPPLPAAPPVARVAPAPPPRRALVIARLDAPPEAEARWLGEGVADMLATALAERPRLEVMRRGAGVLRL